MNGTEVNMKDLIKNSCYIMQEALLQPLLTPYEAMTFVASLKLNVVKPQRENIVSTRSTSLVISVALGGTGSLAPLIFLSQKLAQSSENTQSIKINDTLKTISILTLPLKKYLKKSYCLSTARQYLAGQGLDSTQWQYNQYIKLAVGWQCL